MPQQATLDEVLRYLRAACESPPGGDRTDGELLERFLAQRDEAAFAMLVQRHGPMILGVCRRVLGDTHHAEDAFQATFLVLVRRAATLRKAPLGSWLYAVAQRIAMRARGQASTRLARERRFLEMPRAESLDELTWQELRGVLDEEIGRLPEKYRAPLVLCYFEGKSYEQAACELGWPKSTLAKRLTRARELLRRQLVRHSITLSAGALSTALGEKATAAPVGVLLTIHTVKAAASVVARGTAACASVSSTAMALAEEAMKATGKLQGKLVLLVVGLGFALGGIGLAAQQLAARSPLPVPEDGFPAAFQADPTSKQKGPLEAQPDNATRVTGKDVVEGYKKNFEQFRSLRVAWRHSVQKKEEWFRREAGEISRHEKLAAKTPDGDEKEALLMKIAWLRRQVEAPFIKEPTVVYLDYWTNRNAFQMRQPSYEMRGVDPYPKRFANAFAFPDVAIIKNKEADFKEMYVLNFNGDPKLPFRNWSGEQKAGTYHGIAFKEPELGRLIWPFPPLGINNEQWGHLRAWHEFDRFFAETPVATMSAVGSEKLDGRSVTVFEVTQVETDLEKYMVPEMAKEYKGKLRYITITTTWIDVARGFMPLKIEWAWYTVFGDKDYHYSTFNGPCKQLVVEEVRSMPGGGFYPAKGLILTLAEVLTKEQLDDGYNYDQFLKGAYASRKPGIYEETRWEVLKIQANQEMPKEMFESPFPANTEFHEYKNNE